MWIPSVLLSLWVLITPPVKSSRPSSLFLLYYLSFCFLLWGESQTPVEIPVWKEVFRDPSLPLMVDIGSGMKSFSVRINGMVTISVSFSSSSNKMPWSLLVASRLMWKNYEYFWFPKVSNDDDDESLQAVVDSLSGLLKIAPKEEIIWVWRYVKRF